MQKRLDVPIRGLEGTLVGPEGMGGPPHDPARPKLTQRVKKMPPKKGGRGDPEAGASRAGRFASAARTSWVAGLTGVLLLTAIVSVTALVGMAITARVLTQNVRRLDDRITADRERIAADRERIEALLESLEVLEDEVTVLNETMPEGNGTVFFDDEWVMAHGDDPPRQFQFNASLITTSHPGARRNYALPDEDGVLALVGDIPAAQTEFADDAFAIFLAGDPSTRIEFDLSMIDAGVTRTYDLPNKDGTLATLDDIIILAQGPNQTVFLDSQFAVENDPDTSKSAAFDVSQVSGDRVFVFPNLDGTFVLTEGAQTVADKTLVANSTLIGGPAGAGEFDADALTTTRTYSLTDSNQVLLGRTGIDWTFAGMGWATSTGTFSLIRVASAFQRDRFFQFAALGSGSGGDIGRAGIEFTWFNMHSYRLYTRTGGGLDLSYSQAGIPSTNNDLGSPILRIEPVNGVINFVDRNDPTKRARFDISGLSTARTFAFPNKGGTFALLSDIPPANSDLNTVIGWNRHSGRYFLSGSQGIPDGSFGNLIGWDPDTDPENHLNGVGTSYLVTEPGFYALSAQLRWESHTSTGMRRADIQIIRNAGFTSRIASDTIFPPTGTESIQVVSTAAIEIASGEEIQVSAKQFTGSSTSVLGIFTFFSVKYLGPINFV